MQFIKFIFAFLILVHGLIHVIGFAKAFKLSEVHLISQSISKPFGILWLLTFIGFSISTVLFLRKDSQWYYIAFIAVVCSQILIFAFWKEAKWGSILNFAIVSVAFVAFNRDKFERVFNEEVSVLISTIPPSSSHPITDVDIQELPINVQKWLRHSGIKEKNSISSLYLKQKGDMKIKPKSDWLAFTAEQYFNAVKPSFIWKTEVAFLPFMQLVGKDKFVNGKGEMQITLGATINVVNEGNNPKINEGAMLRYLAEICWFPTAALNEYLYWESIDDYAAKVTFSYNTTSVSGIFYFTNEGDIIAFEAMRFYGGGLDSPLRKWRIEMLDYKIFDDIPYTK